MRIRLDHPTSADEIAALSGGVSLSHATVTHLTTDSREVEPGDLFVALEGENGDGHHYLSQARKKGAALLFCRRMVSPPPEAVLVPDTADALAAWAGNYARAVAPTVIAVTGSVGKTTTKDMIASVLGTSYPTHKTAGNFNNRLGVSLTLLTMPRASAFLVAEAGMNHAGELTVLSEMLRPDIAVITNIGLAHVGHLGSRAAIAHAKMELLSHCRPGALCLFPAEEPLLRPVWESAVTPLPISAEGNGDCAVTDIRPGDEETRFSFRLGQTCLRDLIVPGTGRHLALCAAFASAVGLINGVPPDRIRRGLLARKDEETRETVRRIGSVTVIEDCYNASPESMKAAAAALTTRAHGARTVALLGDMLELGSETRRLHEEIGACFAAMGLGLLVTFGAAAGNYARGARDSGMPEDRILEIPDPADHAGAARALAARLRPGDILLVKASRALRAERIVTLLAPLLPEQAGSEKKG